MRYNNYMNEKLRYSFDNVEPANIDELHKGIGQKVSNVFDNLISVHEFQTSSAENFNEVALRDYEKNHFDENMAFLRNNNVDEATIKTYTDIVNDHPGLKNVALLNIDALSAGSSPAYYDRAKNTTNATVRFNFRNPDIYRSEKYTASGDLQGMYLVICEMALRFGALPKDIANNTELIAAFALAHEFGHSYDFQENSLKPVIEKYKNSGSLLNKPAIIKEAVMKSDRERTEDLSDMLNGGLEIDASTNASKVSSKDEILASRFHDLGIDPDGDDRLAVQARSYRKSRSEIVADAFAMDFITKHRDRFFYNPKKEPANGRVPLNPYENTVALDNKMLGYMGFEAGKKVDFTLIKSEDKIFRGDTFLDEPVRIGHELKINRTGDPRETKNNIASLGIVESIRLRQTNNSGIVSSVYHIKLKDRNYFVSIRRDGRSINEFAKREAPNISTNSAEFEDEFKIKNGNKVTLLRRRGNNKSAPNTISGCIFKNASGNFIKEGDEIHLSPDANADLEGGRTPRVKSFFRNWKTYFVKTEDGTVYEILPHISS